MEDTGDNVTVLSWVLKSTSATNQRVCENPLCLLHPRQTRDSFIVLFRPLFIPHIFPCSRSRGNFYCFKQYVEALHHLTQAVLISPDNAKYRRALGLTKQAMGNEGGALGDLLAAELLTKDIADDGVASERSSAQVCSSTGV